MVEAALSLSMFLVMMLVGIDLLNLAYTSLSLQFVASVTARQASLAEMSDIEVAERAVSIARRFGVNVSSSTGVYMCPVKNYSTCGNLESDFEQGQSGEIVALRVDANFNSLMVGQVIQNLSRRQFRIGRTVVMRREPNE